MTKQYARDGPQEAVQVFLQRYVYRAAEEAFHDAIDSPAG